MTAPATLDRINDFPGLVRYLRDELEWEIPEDAAFGDLTFNWTPSEIGLDLDEPIEITQLRPLRADQRWGVFFLNFPHGKLPVTLMRRILRGLSKRKRASANAADRAAWDKDDLIFISAVGDADDRRLSFAHFQERGNDLPTLRVIGWDKDDTVRRLSHTDQALRTKLGWRHGEGLPLNWRDAFTERPRESVRTAKEMAEALAALARDIRDRIKLILPKEKADGDLKQLFEAVKQTLSRDLDTAKFADTYAQTIAYGLLSARINQVRERDEKHEAAQKTEPGPKPALPAITAEAAGQAMPTTNPFLKELFGSFLSAGGRDAGGTALDFDELGIGEVVDLLNAADMEAVLLDFDKHKAGDDPVIHFYEGFLHAYDKALKVQRGVFYTPRPVVSFIVRSVDEMLRTDFGLDDGLADTSSWADFVAKHPGAKIPPGVGADESFVKILDPATGTGTFLVEVVDLIHTTMTKKWKAAGLGDKARTDAWNDYVPQHLLPRLYGFELMMAPYAVAHMKLGLKLADTGYRFGGLDGDGKPARARVFLSNALEPARDLGMELSFMSEALAHEAKAANVAKHKARFTVVVGNPPYSIQSQNLEPAARALVQPYKFVDGEPIRERNALQLEKNIQDDYIKFMRLAEVSILLSGVGIFGYITNHSYLDGATLRGVRRSLLNTYSDIRVIDLHGNSTKQESPPDGSTDEPVFDIAQGVAIALMARSHMKTTAPWFGEMWGAAEAKLDRMNAAVIGDLASEQIQPSSPFYFLKPTQSAADADPWNRFPELTSMMPTYSMGVKTSRDPLATAFDSAELIAQVTRFAESSSEPKELAEEFGIKLKPGWNTVAARSRVLELQSSVDRAFLYRPFDIRRIYFDKSIVFSMAPNVMNGLAEGKTVALVATRQTKDQWDIQCADVVVGHKSLGAYDANSVFPLWLPQRLGAPNLNLAPDVNRRISELTGLTFAGEGGSDATPTGQGATASRCDLITAFGPRDVFDWTYAILHSPAYRARYTGFLKSAFPRVPLPRDRSLFAALVPFGTELIALHLLDPLAAPILAEPSVRFVNPNGVAARLDDRRAGSRRNASGRVYVNDACWFETVPASTWSRWIGGYQPAQRWLKDRAAKGGKSKSDGRVLTLDDQLHYRRTIVALKETDRVMAEIDRVIAEHGGWPDAFSGMTA